MVFANALQAGDAEAECRSFANECLSNRINSWNAYANNMNLSVKERSVLQQEFCEVFHSMPILLSEQLMLLFLKSRWSKWFNPWHIFYQLEDLITQ